MTVAPAFTDAEAAARDWVNSLTDDLVGTGYPLPLGAHLKRLRSPYRGAYVLLTSLPGEDGFTAEHGSRTRISAAVYGVTKADAAQAAVAYANALRRLYAGNTVVGGTVIYVVDAITGPFYLPDGDEERYVVDADFYLGPWLPPYYGAGAYSEGTYSL